MELDAEIFAIGKWNGIEFTHDDLAQIAATFGALGENMRVALKMGHNDTQPMTDGHPALGWVDNVWVAGDKLMAHFKDMPKIVMDAIQKKLYRNVSVEMDVGVSHKGNNYPYVLTGVALLGADIPAVSILTDLTHYLSRDAAFSVGRRAVFSAIAGNQAQGVLNMEQIQQLTKQVADLTAQLATFTANAATMSAEKTALEAKVSRFEEDVIAATAIAAKQRIDATRNAITAILEDGVKAFAITPAQRETFSKVLRLDNDAALELIDIAHVRALIPAGKQAFSKEQGRQGGEHAPSLRADAQVSKEIAALQAVNPTLTFPAAQKIVFDRNPQLARDYVSLNDEE